MKTKTKKILAVASILSLFFTFVAMAGWPYPTETVPQTQTILNSYFMPSNQPTATNFAELIDTAFWLANQEYTNAQAAAVSAASAATNAPFAVARGYFAVSSYTGTGFAFDENVNITNATYYHPSGGSEGYYFAFQTPFANTNYYVECVSALYATTSKTIQPISILPTLTNCLVVFSGNVNGFATTNFYLRFWK